MDLPSPDQLKAEALAFLMVSKRKDDRDVALELDNCDPEMRSVRDNEGNVIELQVVFRCTTRETFESFKEEDPVMASWRERDAFFRVKSAVRAILGSKWKLGHFDFIPACRVKEQETQPAARPKQKRGAAASKRSPPSLKGPQRTLEKERTQEEEALRLFALVKKLDGEGGRPPLVITVFQLYCVEGLSAEKVCQRCKCGKGTVLARLKKLREVTGKHPRALRSLSGQFERIEKELSDSRARRIHRQNAMDQPQEDELDQD